MTITQRGMHHDLLLLDDTSPHPPGVVDEAMYLLSKAGDDGRLWIALALAQASLGRRSWRSAGVALAWLGVESAVVNLGLKRVFRRSRPGTVRVHPTSFRVPHDTSFPSGHAASAAHMAVALSDSPASAAAFGTLALGIGASRCHLGVHHPSDVVAGFAVGTAFGLLARRSGATG